MLRDARLVSSHPFRRTFTATCGHSVASTPAPLPEVGFTTSSARVTCPTCQQPRGPQP